MNAFSMVATAVAMLIGLSLTRLLTSLVGVFLARLQARIVWMPVMWAVAVFVELVQGWWAVIELETRSGAWTRGDVVMLMTVPLMLFLAAALLLPYPQMARGDDLEAWFEQHGRWGLLPLAGYAAICVVVNVSLFQVELFSAATALLMPELVLPLAYLATRAKGLQAVVTVAYFVQILVSSWLLSPASY